MSKNKDINDRYGNAKIEDQIKIEYENFLVEEREENNSDSAQIFAMRKINDSGGYKYMGRNERDLILLLAGELPQFYD